MEKNVIDGGDNNFFGINQLLRSIILSEKHMAEEFMKNS